MSGRRLELLEWQRRYAAAPEVWTVLVGDETFGNLYDSREAAQVEADFHTAQLGSYARASVHKLGHIHSLALSRDRWER